MGRGGEGREAAKYEATSSMVWTEMDSLMKNVTPKVDQVHFSLTWINDIMDLNNNLKRKLLSETYSGDLNNIFVQHHFR